jgi:polyhydroxyalkanoate synthesis repressor PhaR
MADDNERTSPASQKKSAAGAKTGQKGAGKAAADPNAPVTIKKYANRRLYNTATSSYVTLEHLCKMVKEGIDFAVYDAKTGEDITRSVLTQIIVEEEAKTGQNLLPIGFLRQLIGYYGDNVQQMMLPQYLDFSLRSFTENQEKMRSYMSDTMETVFPFGAMEEVGKRNMEIFERAMRAFTPFAAVGAVERSDIGAEAGAEAGAGAGAGAGESTADAAAEQSKRVQSLQNQLSEMQDQLKEIQKK